MNPRAPGSIRPVLVIAAAAFTLAMSGNVSALPEDRQQTLEIDADSQEGTLNQDMTFRGSDEKPAQIIQGSMRVSGNQIHIKWIDGEIQSVVAEGNPARFQQQPAAEDPVVHISGQSMTLDNVKQTITVDRNVEYNQGGNSMSSNHLDYNMTTGTANATSVPGGDRVRMSIQPQNAAESPTP